MKLFLLTIFLLLNIISCENKLKFKKDLIHNRTRIPFVVGGTKANFNEFPYQAALRRKYNPEGLAFCGAVIIDEHWLLTAAHCVVDDDLIPRWKTVEDIEIVIGGHELRSAKSTPFVVHPEKVVHHPKYMPSIVANDIAMIKSKESLFVRRVSQVSRAIALPHVNQDFDGIIGTASGYGKTNGLSNLVLSPEVLKTQLLIKSQESCRYSYPDMDWSTICVTSNGEYKATCSGDSGGPLAVSFNGKKVLVGLTSYHYGECASDFHNFFTKVSYFIPWIRETIAKN